MNYIDAVTFILVRPDGKILMQKRDDGRGKEIPYPNMWCFPGGGKESGEDHIEATVREIKEEYNLDVPAECCKLIFAYDHDNNLGDQVFVCKVPQDASPELYEGAEMQWMAVEEIKNLQLAWQQNQVFDRIEDAIRSLS